MEEILKAIRVYRRVYGDRVVITGEAASYLWEGGKEPNYVEIAVDTDLEMRLILARFQTVLPLSYDFPSQQLFVSSYHPTIRIYSQPHIQAYELDGLLVEPLISY